MNRRQFLRASVLGAASLSPSCRLTTGLTGKHAATPASGEWARSFDSEMENFMTRRRVPGGALAVVKDRRLVYARGYGWADREKQVPATPQSLFRIASVSKPITALAVMKLVETGRLDLDARAFSVLNLPAGSGVESLQDSRLDRITVRQLLQHTGGWDRDKSFDPMFRPIEIAEAVGVAAPADAHAVIRYMLRQPLDFDPGTRYAYSNFGYCVLGRIIERISGKNYESFVRETVLQPSRIRAMRIGATLDGRQAPREVRYYLRGRDEANSVFPELSGKVPWPYGGFHLEAMDAHGGWIASAVDLARIAAMLFDPSRCPFLNANSLEVMAAPPAAPVSRQTDGTLNATYYGCGWMIRPHGRARQNNLWHSGSLPGTATLFVRRGDGLSWVALFNQRSAGKRLPDSAIDPALHRAADAVKSWPAHDLFNEFE